MNDLIHAYFCGRCERLCLPDGLEVALLAWPSGEATYDLVCKDRASCDAAVNQP